MHAFPAPHHDARQRPGAAASWCEVFSFEWLDLAGGGGYLTLVLRPNLGQAWVWAYATGAPEPVTALDLPVPDGLTVRGEGLALALACETPLRQWTATVESAEVSADLRFSADGRPDGGPEPPRYAYPSKVTGTVLGRPFDGLGGRGHLWADVDWSDLGTRILGRTDSGERLLCSGPDAGSLDVAFDPVVRTVVPAYGPDGTVIELSRQLGRLCLPDGRTGWGWLAGPAR